jgi:hypothetical protein
MLSYLLCRTHFLFPTSHYLRIKETKRKKERNYLVVNPHSFPQSQGGDKIKGKNRQSVRKRKEKKKKAENYVLNTQ